MFVNAVGEYPRTICKFGGVDVKALVDTGSVVSIMTKSLFVQYIESQVEDNTYWFHVLVSCEDSQLFGSGLSVIH